METDAGRVPVPSQRRGEGVALAPISRVAAYAGFFCASFALPKHAAPQVFDPSPPLPLTSSERPISLRRALIAAGKPQRRDLLCVMPLYVCVCLREGAGEMGQL